MAVKTPQIMQTLSSMPVPMMLEQLGVSIAKAQAALDANSIRMAKEMSEVEVEMGDKSYNLLSLGFTPTFYAFTEATIEVKMEMSIAESESYGGTASLNYGKSHNQEGESGTESSMFGISVSAHYSRKFSVNAEASSSIAAKLVSLPAPDAFNAIIKNKIEKTNK